MVSSYTKTGRPNGVRLNRRQQDVVRSHIQATQIVKRLHAHLDGDVELSQTQIQAAKILLDKALSNAPDIKEISGPDGGELPSRLVIELVKADPALLPLLDDRVR